MQVTDIYERITDILRNEFDDDTIVARPDLTAGQVPGWDSFAHLRLIFTIEKSFGISFAASEMSGLKNVGELAELIERKTSR